MEQRESEIQRIIAWADLYELLRAAFTFPTEELAQALVDGSFGADVLACLEEASFEARDIETADNYCKRLEKQAEVDSLFAEMKKDYSHLYLGPGELRVIYPYEGAFLYAEKNEGQIPALFFTATANDVERQMREAGVVPQNARIEPVDSIQNELEFMMFLYVKIASCIQEGKIEEESVWRLRMKKFYSDHILPWVPRFLEKTSEAAKTEVYRALVGIAFLIVQGEKE